ncbi:MAG TPA: hypothetical protein VJB63_00150 [Patescibacteria group bacterium]|nr:hypothetical protein [Patescibacteria group bacterium]
MQYKKNTLYLRGQSLVEILLVIGLISVLFPAITVGILASREGKAQKKQRISATALMKETIEATRSTREIGWTSFAINGTFHPEVSGSSWILSSGGDMVNGFTRAIDISNVFRDSSGTIVLVGGTLDPSTKKVITTIAWNTPFPSSVQSTMYLTRTDNLSYTETTEAQFNTGTKNGVVITNTNGGEITLGSGGASNWCEPNLNLTPLDLPKQGVANAITAIEGRIFAGTGDNSSGESFVNIAVSNTLPPIATIMGTFDGYKTNDVFGETNYGYLATDTNSKEIVIIDISQVPYSEVGYFDAPGSTDASSVFILGTTGYMLQGSYLRNFDLNSKIGARPAIDPDGVSLSGAIGTSLYVAGRYAYVTTTAAVYNMVIIDLNNPSNLLLVAGANMNGLVAKDVIANSTGSRLYAVTEGSSQFAEFYIWRFDLSGPIPIFYVMGTYDTNGMNPKAVRIVPGNRAIVVGLNQEEYQVIDMSNELNPVRCGGLNINTGINGIASVLETDGDAFSYIITGDANAELKIIQGGPGGLYTPTGNFESATFDTGYQTAFNRISFSVIKPVNTTITFQIASADAISSSCSSVLFDYVGPDGTNTTFFNTPGPLPLDDDAIGFENPAQCVRYKAFLSTTDTFASPILEDITLNYSP